MWKWYLCIAMKFIHDGQMSFCKKKQPFNSNFIVFKITGRIMKIIHEYYGKWTNNMLQNLDYDPVSSVWPHLYIETLLKLREGMRGGLAFSHSSKTFRIYRLTAEPSLRFFFASITEFFKHILRWDKLIISFSNVLQF